MKQTINGKLFPLVLLFTALTFISCGSFIGIGSDGGNSSTSLSGRSSKGPISGARIEVNSLNPDGSTGEMLGSVTSGADGRYLINLGDYSGSVLITLTGGEYRDEATGTVVKNDLTLHTALTDVSGKVSAMVTPLTELAFRKAGTLTGENIEGANAFVSLLTGIDILSCEPIDPSDSGEASGATNEQKSYSLLLAALSQMSKNGMIATAASRASGAVPAATYGDLSNILDTMEQDIADGDLNTVSSQLVNGLVSFLESDQNSTGILDLNDTGLDEALFSGGENYSGVWYETDGDSGEFTLSFKFTDDFFEGTFFVSSHGVEGQKKTYSIEGTRKDNSYRGTDSLGRDFIFKLVKHPVTGSGNILAGSYRDTATGERGSLRSTYSNSYNSAVGFVTVDGAGGPSGTTVSLQIDPFFSALTNEHGFFILGGLPDGIHRLQASKEGFEPGDSGPWSFTENATHHPNVNITLREIPQNPPLVVTGAASEITTSEAKLNGSVTPSNLATEAWFEWGESATSFTHKTERQSVGAGDIEVPLSYGVTGLTPGTTYYVRLVAENSAGASAGGTLPFTTGKPAAPPVATTQPATNITTGSATLNGSVNPNDLPTEAWFEWGTSSSSLVNSTPRQSAGSGSSSLSRQYVLTGLEAGRQYFFRLVAANIEGSEEGAIHSFTTAKPAVPPGTSTKPATSIAIQSANINGSVNPNGFATEAWFEWGASSSSLANSTPRQSAGSGNSSGSFHFGLSGLDPETTYYFRAMARNSGGTMKGDTLSFTTKKLPVPPGTVTKAATSVTTDSGRLNGSVNPNGFATEAWFEWGTGPSSLANRTSTSSIGSGNSPGSFEKTINSLKQGTTYYFRAVAQNSGGTMKGETLSFTTAVPALPPGATTLPAISVTTNGASLKGTVNPNGFATESWFEWGTSSSSLTNVTPSQEAGFGTATREVVYSLSGLSQGTPYYFRIVARSSAGTMKGSVEKFTTEPTKATLTWKAPTSNADGSYLNDLAGYRIYYGMTSRNYSEYIDVGNVTSYTVYNLPVGKIFFALTSYDVAGNESAFSAELYKVIE